MRDFLLRKSCYEFILGVRDTPIGLAALDAVCAYGINESVDFERYHNAPYSLSEKEINCLKLILPQYFEEIDRTDQRHKRAVINGRNGGLKGGKFGGRGNKKSTGKAKAE